MTKYIVAAIFAVALMLILLFAALDDSGRERPKARGAGIPLELIISDDFRVYKFQDGLNTCYLNMYGMSCVKDQ